MFSDGKHNSEFIYLMKLASVLLSMHFYARTRGEAHSPAQPSPALPRCGIKCVKFAA